ncbi:MAG: DUF4294 domain-containing protein [Pedobacter sp.]|nr:MAG: DUF4294 domain-containing protein [Pedobacter sp.]
MKFSRFIILFIVMIGSFSASAQKLINGVIWPETGKNDTIIVSATNENGYMIPWIGLKEVVIYGKRTFRSAEELAAFNRLRYNVLKVLPYAKYAKNRYAKLEQDLALTTDKKVQKKLVKQCDDEIKKLFNTEIKELTITQGKILTKLIDRELNQSTYDIVRETKGKFAAFSYQLVARVVGHNLKTTYNPREERDIESIIVSAGYY